MTSRQSGVALPCGCVIGIIVACLIAAGIAFAAGSPDTGIAFLVIAGVNIIINGFLLLLRGTGLVQQQCPNCGASVPSQTNTCPNCYHVLH